jgi:hypothetical protein
LRERTFARKYSISGRKSYGVRTDANLFSAREPLRSRKSGCADSGRTRRNHQRYGPHQKHSLFCPANRNTLRHHTV